MRNGERVREQHRLASRILALQIVGDDNDELITLASQLAELIVTHERVHHIEYAVDDTHGDQQVFDRADEAAGFAISMALSHGEEVHIDVLCWDREAAVAYRGSSDGGEEYDEDPEASVFERICVQAEAIGRVS